MAGLKRLVLFVEGEGDVAAMPALVRKLVERHAGLDYLFVDPAPFRVKGLSNLTGSKDGKWARFLAAAAKRANLGAVLLVLDGDCDGCTITTSLGEEEFCAAATSRVLASLATKTRAGTDFSVAVVFARQEFESWLIGGVPFLATAYEEESGDDFQKLETAPRDAKKWIRTRQKEGYKPTQHQAPLANAIDLDLAIDRLRSFRRLDHAVRELVDAVRSQKHVVTPR
jgi:hypothetical protein